MIWARRYSRFLERLLTVPGVSRWSQETFPRAQLTQQTKVPIGPGVGMDAVPFAGGSVLAVISTMVFTILSRIAGIPVRIYRENLMTIAGDGVVT